MLVASFVGGVATITSLVVGFMLGRKVSVMAAGEAYNFTRSNVIDLSLVCGVAVLVDDNGGELGRVPLMFGEMQNGTVRFQPYSFIATKSGHPAGVVLRSGSWEAKLAPTAISTPTIMPGTSVTLNDLRIDLQPPE